MTAFTSTTYQCGCISENAGEGDLFCGTCHEHGQILTEHHKTLVANIKVIDFYESDEMIELRNKSSV